MVKYDVILIGGSFSNCLLAWQLAKVKPWLRLVLLEERFALGGNQTWIFLNQLLSVEASRWMAPLLSASWPEFEVLFTKGRRVLPSSLSVIRSHKLNAVIQRELGDKVRCGHAIAQVSAGQVILATGEVLEAPLIVDGRPSTAPRAGLSRRYLGLEVRTSQPHGLKVPILQELLGAAYSGERYLTCLPWTADRLLIRTSDYGSGQEDARESLRATLFTAARKRGWAISEIFREEEGVEKILFAAEAAAPELTGVKDPGLLMAAENSGLTHPTLNEDVILAIRWVEQILSQHDEPLKWVAPTRAWVKGQQRAQSYFIGLNQTHFLKQKNQAAFFERLFAMPVASIEAFFGSQMTAWDQFCFLLSGLPLAHALSRKTIARDLVTQP